MEPRLILIDGYNVIRNTPGLAAADRASLAAGRDGLLQRVVATYRHTPHRVIVVFDGDRQTETIVALPGRARGQVIYTPHGVTADVKIERLAVEAEARGERVTAVSGDFEVRLGATQAGARSARPEELAGRLNQPSRDLAKRARHRAAVRAQLDARDEDQEGQDARGPGGGRKKGNPRRSPRRRRGPGESLL
ncbi:MAG: NYN domain-containing protein [Gammaproteobacteria bacterium]|nr:NYN domain-containing protein [Gammaproteobacteria bacterium]